MTDNVKYYGFRHVKSLWGPPTPPAIRMRVASGYQGAINGGTSIDINIGDPVRRVSTGTVAHAAGIEAAAGAYEDIYGIVVGILPYYDGTRMRPGNRLPGNTVYGSVQERASYVMVQPVAGQLFACLTDDLGAGYDTETEFVAFVGENVNHILKAGSEPKANPLLDISEHATTAFQWRIEEISATLNNVDYAGLYVELYVTCNKPQAAAFATTGI